MKYIIVNPKAGRGYCQEIIPKIKAFYKELNQNHIIVSTQYPGHATELAVEALEYGAKEIIAVGGDGTLLEVIQKTYDEDVTFGVIPAGTGNDFARSLGFSLDIDEFLHEFNNAVVRPIDLCLGSDSAFISICGIGFISDVLNHINTNRNSILKGKLAFINGVIQTIRKLKANEMQICIDGKCFTKKAVMASVVNGMYVGGGMKFVPDAKIDDGFLDVFLVKEVGKLELLSVFPKVYKGEHADHHAVEFYRGQEVTITTKNKMVKSYDGTLIGDSPVNIKLAKHKLKFLASPNY